MQADCFESRQDRLLIECHIVTCVFDAP